MSDERGRQVELYRHCLGHEMSLTDALRLAGDLAGAIGLVYTPRRCFLAKLDGARLVDDGGEAVAGDAFEARVFNERRELRWLQTGMDGTDRLGRAVLVGEEPPDGFAGEPIRVEPLPRQYILWGQGDGPTALPPGWSQVSLARVGPLKVPLPGVGRGDLVALIAREYIARHYETGNAYVADERLTGLRRHAGEDSDP